MSGSPVALRFKDLPKLLESLPEFQENGKPNQLKIATAVYTIYKHIKTGKLRSSPQNQFEITDIKSIANDENNQNAFKLALIDSFKKKDPSRLLAVKMPDKNLFSRPGLADHKTYLDHGRTKKTKASQQEKNVSEAVIHDLGALLIYVLGEDIDDPNVIHEGVKQHKALWG